MTHAEAGHDIATRAAQLIVGDAQAAGLSWTEMLLSCETTLTIVALMACEMTAPSVPTRFVAEMLDTITERAQERAAAMLLGVPYNG